MLIIIEGPDGSGKSTLHQSLKTIKGTHLIFLSTNEREPDPGKFFRLTKDISLLAEKHTVILDRHPVISELVYGPILRPQESFLGSINWEDPGIVKNILGEEPVIILYCKVPIDSQYYSRLSKIPQMRGVTNHLSEIKYKYDELMSQIKKSFIFNVIEVDPFDPRQKIKEMLTEILQQELNYAS